MKIYQNLYPFQVVSSAVPIAAVYSMYHVLICKVNGCFGTSIRLLGVGDWAWPVAKRSKAYCIGEFPWLSIPLCQLVAAVSYVPARTFVLAELEGAIDELQ